MIETLERTFETLSERDSRIHEVAEIGWRRGGAFPPHKTHRRGFSVDIMTPMRRVGNQQPTRLGTSPLSLFGYCRHIDDQTQHLTGLRWDAPSVRG